MIFLRLPVIIIMVLLHCVSARIETIPVPSDIQQCLDDVQSNSDLGDVIGENVIARCVHGLLWTKDTPNMAVSNDTLKWFNDLVDRSVKEAHKTRWKRQSRWTRHQRIRKEYRDLTDLERRRYHRAIQLLKADTSVSPNKYDALGMMHFHLVGRAHLGPSFLPWHRIFLVVAENALREKMPGVTIPYWDSTLDSGLRDPRTSILWQEDYFGNANGFVTSGPYRNWVTPIGRLMRHFDSGGALLNWTSIDEIFKMKHLANISFPDAKPKHNFEEQHNEVHRWVGGHMAPPALAAFDPIFYSHHAFADLVWELFRQSQRRKGVDPTVDYPGTGNITSGHGYDNYTGIGYLLNRHGLSDIFLTNIYSYERPPTCTKERPLCDSQKMRCDTRKSKPRCVTVTIFDAPPPVNAQGLPMNGGSGIREARSTHRRSNHQHGTLSDYIKTIKSASDLHCTKQNVNEKFANNYNIDGVADPAMWVYISVEVVHRQLHVPGSHKPRPAVHQRCLTNRSLPKRVFVESEGLNYRGSYEDITHIQKDLSTSSSIRYIGVKSPDHNVTDVFITGYDSCGRVCRPFCRDKGSNRYTPCSGAIRVTPDLPFMYGRDVNTMVSDVWDSRQGEFPERDDSKIFIKLLCEDSISWPW